MHGKVRENVQIFETKGLHCIQCCKAGNWLVGRNCLDRAINPRPFLPLSIFFLSRRKDKKCVTARRRSRKRCFTTFDRPRSEPVYRVTPTGSGAIDATVKKNSRAVIEKAKVYVAQMHFFVPFRNCSGVKKESIEKDQRMAVKMCSLLAIIFRISIKAKRGNYGAIFLPRKVSLDKTL